MTEFEQAKKYAGIILDRVGADPDDDIAVLARTFLRQVETIIPEKITARGLTVLVDMVEVNLAGHLARLPFCESALAAIDGAIVEAFKVGFRHAVEGGHEAPKRLPQLKGSTPLVLYFANDADRQEMVDAVAGLPRIIETDWPGKKTDY